MKRFGNQASMAILTMLCLASPALGHIKLASSSPAAKATVSRPGRIVLTFSDTVTAKTIKTELTMISMPGMADHPPMKMTGFTSQMGADGKTVTLLMKQALPVGGYILKWSAAGTDTHMMTGEVPFNVK